MGRSFRSKAATDTDTGMGARSTAVAATTTVGTFLAAITMVGGIMVIGGEQTERERPHELAASFIEMLLAHRVISRAGH